MKNNLQKFLGLAGVLLATTVAHADNFIGNGDNTFDGAIGKSTLEILGFQPLYRAPWRWRVSTNSAMACGPASGSGLESSLGGKV